MCFPLSLQFGLILRFMMDNTQTPNSRVKVATLHYLITLLREMQPSDLTAVTLQHSGSKFLSFCAKEALILMKLTRS